MEISLVGEDLHIDQEALSLPLEVEVEKVVDEISGQEQALTNCAQLIKDVLNEHSRHSIQLGENLLYKSIRPKGVKCFEKYGLDPRNEVYYFYYKHASKHAGKGEF